MAASIGLPSLTIRFEAAAQTVANRSKKGVVAVMVRDTKETGVHPLSTAALIPATLGQDNQDYIARAFTGSDRGGPSKVIAVVIGTGTEDTSALEEGLKLIESYSIDYLAAPPDVTEAEETVLKTWVENQRKAYRTVKWVAPGVAADSMGVIDFEDTGLAVGSKTYTAAQYCSRIAGILAGIPMGSSATYASLGELSVVTARTGAEQAAAIDAGKLILIHDGQKAKIARAVNSLTTIPADGREDWRKIKIVEGMDLITYYLRTTIEDEYIGRFANTYDNKCLLVTAITDYFSYLEQVGVLSKGESYVQIDVEAQEKWLKSQGVETAGLTQQQIKEHDTGSWVFLKCGGRLTDAMEDFEVLFNNL